MNTTSTLSFLHHYEAATDPRRPPLLLLHGTGGNETDLLGLGRAVSPGSALLSPRGKVLEHGMPRFFRRLAEGVFDEADLRLRTEELARFIAEAREHYGLPALVAIGFSNGANVAAALLMLRPDVLAGAVLLRAMTPFADPPPADLDGRPVLILSGSADPIVPAATSERLARQLAVRRASVELKPLPASHALTPTDLRQTARWLQALSEP